MKSSEQMNEIATGLAKAQAEISNPKKDRTARVHSERTGTDYSYNYADLACVLDAVRPALSKNGIALIQTPEVGPPSEWIERGDKTWRTARLTITTRLIHSSGQWIESDLVYDVDPDDRVQSLGSAISYLRRYALQSIVGIAAEEDDDGAAANRRQQDLSQYHEQRQPPAERRQEPAPQQRQSPAPAPAAKPQPKVQALPPVKEKAPAPAPLEPIQLDEAISAELATLRKSATKPIAEKIWALFKKSDQKIQRLAVLRGANAAIEKISRTTGKAGERMIADLTIDRSDPDNAQGIIDDLAKAAGMALPPSATGEDRPPY